MPETNRHAWHEKISAMPILPYGLTSSKKERLISRVGVPGFSGAIDGYQAGRCRPPWPPILHLPDEEMPLQKRDAAVAVIGAGDYIGGEIARKFASEGFTVFAGRRNGAKLDPLVKSIEAAGGEIHARSLDARKEEEIVSFLSDADKHAPLEVCIFNIGANVNFPILETTERVFRKVWEMACYSGFLAGREAARLMLPRGDGNIFFTGATASLRGGTGYGAFASAKFGLRAVAQAAARELGPKNIHVAHLIID